jgi:phenylacetate-CoA ligase
MWDRSTAIAHNAALWRARNWAGLEFGRPYASLLGRVVVPISRTAPPFWKYNRPWRQLFLSSFHLTEPNLPAYIDAMRRYGVEALQAYPSTVYVLARYLEQVGERFPLKWVFTSSETLLDIQRQIIEDRFACRVFDSFGLAERVAYAAECPSHEGHHLFMEYGIVELVDESGTPVPYGSHGRMVATGLHNYGMPLLRYEVGDVSAYKQTPCSCGRGLPLLDKVTTKAEDIVVTPDGRFISSSVMTHPFKPMHHIEASQIIQEARDRLVIKIVKRPAYTDRDTQILLDEMYKRLGRAIHIEVQFVPEIPRSANGKFRWVISKVPLQYAQQKFDNLFAE